MIQRKFVLEREIHTWMVIKQSTINTQYNLQNQYQCQTKPNIKQEIAITRN